MKIVIRATAGQKEELLQKGFDASVSVEWAGPAERLSGINADAFFDLTFNDTLVADNEFIKDKPVFVHAVNCLYTEIDKPNYIRLNAWNGFLNRPVTELVCGNAISKKHAKDIFNKLQWDFAEVADDYGFIAARVIAMIINEAYFALEENVSTKEQIDISMKLGTNYPYGPFAWCKKIGLHNILELLRALSKQDKRYTISGLLVHESQQF